MSTLALSKLSRKHLTSCKWLYTASLFWFPDLREKISCSNSLDFFCSLEICSVSMAILLTVSSVMPLDCPVLTTGAFVKALTSFSRWIIKACWIADSISSFSLMRSSTSLWWDPRLLETLFAFVVSEEIIPSFTLELTITSTPIAWSTSFWNVSLLTSSSFRSPSSLLLASSLPYALALSLRRGPIAATVLNAASACSFPARSISFSSMIAFSLWYFSWWITWMAASRSSVLMASVLARMRMSSINTCSALPASSWSCSFFFIMSSSFGHFSAPLNTRNRCVKWDT